MKNTVDTPKAFGRLVCQRRRALGLQQRELALSANVGERFIVELEAGKPTCQLGKALAVARAVGVKLTDAAAPSQSPGDSYDLPDVPGY